MAQLDLSPRHQSKSLSHRVRLNVDLTPMVDLGFLLITFFILTTTLSQPKSADLMMPKDSKEPTLLKESFVLTLMPVRNNRIDYFEGRNESASDVKHCSYRELRSVIQQKQKKVEKISGSKNETVIIIDPSSESSYENFVDVMDEIQINDIRHYFVVNHQQ
ncbi:MAG TPA: biopolymer transporter ExbD [Hanamia sp.]